MGHNGPMNPRFHCPFPLAPGAGVDLPEQAAHHAVRVLRLGVGDAVTLFDGRGGEWQAAIVRLKPTVHVQLETYDATDREPPLRVTLAQCLPSGDKMDWVVQKAVELGIAAIQPLAAKRSVVKLTAERQARRVQHWQQVAVAACEQSRRNRLPTVAPVLDLPQYLARPARENELRLVLAPGSEMRLRDLPAPEGNVVLLVGPEGGLEEGEALAAASAGFRPVSLGPRVLRTETAGPAALTALMTLWGDF